MSIKKSKSGKAKKTRKSKTKSKKNTKIKAKKRQKNDSVDDSGIIIIDDDLKINKEVELEERRAYLEEARSQEAFD